MPLRDPENAHWRDSARPAMFFIVSAYAILPILIFLLHMRIYTLIIALTVCLFFGIIEKFGFTLPIFRRWFRNFFAGRHKVAKPWWH